MFSSGVRVLCGVSILLVAALSCVGVSAGAQGSGAATGDGPKVTDAGGFVRDSRMHPQEPSRDNAFSMTINKYGIAATLQTLASQASATILARGGNAVDAAIAANAATGVIEPMMNGVGGDLFAVVWDGKEKKIYALNASGWSPKGETIEAMRAKGVTKMNGKSIYSVTVPGAVAGWVALHDRFGKLPLAVDLAPAVALAENGFPVTELDVANWKQYGLGFADRAEFAKVYLPGGTYPGVGQMFRNPELAATLRRIGKEGNDGFYRGPVADAMVKLSEENNGFMTKADLAEFKPEWVEPISTTYHGWRVYETPPNTQGLAALSMLNVMELYPLREWGHDSVKTLHLEMEAKALAYADMLHYVGDPRVVEIPTKKLVSKELARERAKGITERANCAVLASDRKEQLDKLESDTTYLATVDRDGMVVSLIQSNAGNFGSGLVPKGTGFVLQNRGAGFAMQAGQPNSLAGRKRPLHTIIPALMQKGDQTIGFGIMSGFNQAQAHAQFVANVVDFDMNIQAAMDAARFNKGNSGCGVNLEDGYSKEIVEGLAAKGHQVNLVPRYSQVMGRGNAVMHDGGLGVNFGASDPRADGQAVPEQPPF
jgi:gamma-glutamyltranspeptidase/glutathione hydrolase